MKKLITLVTLSFYLAANAQVAVEKQTFRSNGSILEFNDIKEPNGVAKGIILPVLQKTSNIKQGALWVDAITKKVMYKSAQEKIALTEAATKDFTLPQNTDEAESGVIISDGSLSTDDVAILKLDSNKKALLLPHIGDVTKDISNPEPGTIAYDVKSKSLAIFNGENWYF